jgi:cytochrome c556
MRNLVIAGTALAALVAASAGAQPAPPTPEQQAQRAVELRQSVFKLQNWNMEPLAGMLRGTVPFDAALIETNATNISNLSKMISPVFGEDTTAFDVETLALDRIWGSMAEFNTKAVALTTAADALVAAAGAGDDAATRAAIGRVGQACGSCHDDFRAN